MYRIFKNGDVVNTIVADESFVKSYCDENGFAYELVEPEIVSVHLTEAERLAAVESAILSILIGGAANV